MTNPLTEMSGEQLNRLVAALDSLIDGDLAIDMLVACGQRAIPYLAHFLLEGSPRTISLPRCRAVRALGELESISTLISYFKGYKRPQNAAVLFAEDAVRSAVAHELARWKSDKVFHVLLDAARQRVTGGLVLALGEFRRPESVPLLFEVLGDDMCREEAKDSLRKTPDVARRYGILSIRGYAGVEIYGTSAVRRQRATLELLSELGVARDDWLDLRRFLSDLDSGSVIAAAQIGSKVAPESERRQIIRALLQVADRVNCLQEEDIEQLLDAHLGVAREVALQIANHQSARDERPNWLSPLWRIIRHVLGSDLEDGHDGAASAQGVLLSVTQVPILRPAKATKHGIDIKQKKA